LRRWYAAAVQAGQPVVVAFQCSASYRELFFQNIRNITSAWKMQESAQQNTGLSSFNEQTNTCCFCKHGPTPRLGG
jgi:hypothetical protein